MIGLLEPADQVRRKDLSHVPAQKTRGRTQQVGRIARMVVQIDAVAAHEEHHVGQRPKHRILLQERFTSRPEQDDKRRKQADLQHDNNTGENYVQIRRQAPHPIARPGGRSIYLRMCAVNSKKVILHNIYVVLPSLALARSTSMDRHGRSSSTPMPNVHSGSDGLLVQCTTTCWRL